MTKTCIVCGSSADVEVSDQAPHPVLKLCKDCREIRRSFEQGEMNAKNREGNEDTWNYKDKDLESLVKSIGYNSVKLQALYDEMKRRGKLEEIEKLLGVREIEDGLKAEL